MSVILFSGAAILLSILFSWVAGRVQRRVESPDRDRAATAEALARIARIEKDEDSGREE